MRRSFFDIRARFFSERNRLFIVLSLNIYIFAKMHIKFFNTPDAVSADRLAADISRLPEWRRKQTLAIKPHVGRVLSTEAFLLLADALREEYGMEQVPEFSYNVHGKPFFRDYPQISFNLSHCRTAAMCVVADRNVGCDIETLNRKVCEGVLARCFNEEEILSVRSSENPQVEFVRLWTQKEAVGKCRGEGITDFAPYSLLPQNLRNFSLECRVDYSAGYAYSVCQQIENAT